MYLTLFDYRGESVSKESSAAKTGNNKTKTLIGDKVDGRICITGPPDGKIVDLINIEFAKTLESSKYHLDDRKILEESKIIADTFYKNPYLDFRYKPNIQANCIQVTGLEGQVVFVKLVDNGVYVSKKVGSLRLPFSPLNLANARILLQRLVHLKVSISHVRNNYKIMYLSHNLCRMMRFTFVTSDGINFVKSRWLVP